jgi:hypothetical protein
MWQAEFIGENILTEEGKEIERSIVQLLDVAKQSLSPVGVPIGHNHGCSL